MARRRSSIKGAASFPRLLRRLPDAAREQIANYFEIVGARLRDRAKAETPRRTGKLAAAIAYRLAPKTLRLRLGLITRKTQRDYFYGYILDQGRKAQTVTAKRRAPSGKVSTYALRVKPIARSRYDFVFGRMRDFRLNELPKLRNVMDQIIGAAAQGVGND